MQTDDDLYLGPIQANFQARSGAAIGSSPEARGIGPVGKVLVVDYVPTTLATNAIALAQAIAGAANMVLNGALAAAGLATIAEPFGRGLQYVSSNAGDTTQTATVTGTDFLGNAMTERVTLNGTTPVLGKKAFKTVSQIAISAVTVGNVSVGTTDKLGLPVAVASPNLFSRVGWADVLAQDASTFVTPDVTSPATNLTGDTRGTLQPSSASNGARRLTLAILLLDIHVGPSALPFTTATRTGAFGVQPV